MVIMYVTKPDWQLKVTSRKKVLTIMRYSHHCEALVCLDFTGTVAQYELELDQLDVKTAFLYGDLKEEMYMSQPIGFKTVGKENIVYKLKKLFYELKQSPRQLYKRSDSFIRGKKYTRSHYDLCVYYNKLPSEEYIYLLLYVDDILIAFKS